MSGWLLHPNGCSHLKFNIIHFTCKCITFTKSSTDLLHYSIYCCLVLQHVSAWLSRPSSGVLCDIHNVCLNESISVLTCD